jgi:glycosyltransferase involved in cell wall biosynthesis
MLEPWALKFGALKKRLALLAYQARDLASANGFHATSEAEAEGIRRLGLKQPIAVIPNAVSAPDILPARPVLNGSINTALFLSRIHPKKGLTDLVNAWARLRPSDWRLLIVGGSELGHRNEIEQLIRSLGIQQSITISDQVADTDKWAIYAGADLFVLPSYSENFGVVVAEAMLMGLPVITTKATPWAVIREAGCGWYIDTGVPSLSSALDQAFHTTPEQLVAMGRRGRELVHSRFDWVRIAGEMAEFYLWIMYGGSRPLCVYRD